MDLIIQELEDLATQFSYFDVGFIPHVPKGPIAAEDERVIKVFPSFPLFLERDSFQNVKF